MGDKSPKNKAKMKKEAGKKAANVVSSAAEPETKTKKTY